MREPAANAAPARLIPTDAGASALRGLLTLSIEHRDGARVLCLALDGRALDVEVDDVAAAHLAALLSVPSGEGRP